MNYVSTRGWAEKKPAKKVIIQGLAEDGGLYVPATFPRITVNSALAQMPPISYASQAALILKSFLTDFSESELNSACQEAYGEKFDQEAIVPLKILDKQIAVLELWHGPTLAFKDLALQLMPRLLSLALKEEEEKYELVILVATSGDTGKAALEGFADVPGIRIFVFYPHAGVSEIQRLQMVTQRGQNVGVCAVLGNFDDAQNGVKQIFGDAQINKELQKINLRLSSANSINWGRLVPQIVYYFTGYQQMVGAGLITLGDPILICVPTGNFGNILAAFYAQQCGLPVSKFICASNRNKVLTDFLRQGIYDRRREFYRTESPSMDILISSNLERLLFELSGRNPELVRSWMKDLEVKGWYRLPDEKIYHLQSGFYGGFADRQATLQAIQEVFSHHGYLIDPHTAVGYHVLHKYREETGDGTPALLAATASPFKFNVAVLEALGRETKGKDEFSLLRELSALSGQPIPFQLAELPNLPEIHKNVCRKEEMAEVIMHFLKKS
jgi:threonine synthase